MLRRVGFGHIWIYRPGEPETIYSHALVLALIAIYPKYILLSYYRDGLIFPMVEMSTIIPAGMEAAFAYLSEETFGKTR